MYIHNICIQMYIHIEFTERLHVNGEPFDKGTYTHTHKHIHKHAYIYIELTEILRVAVEPFAKGANTLGENLANPMVLGQPCVHAQQRRHHRFLIMR